MNYVKDRIPELEKTKKDELEHSEKDKLIKKYKQSKLDLWDIIKRPTLQPWTHTKKNFILKVQKTYINK